MIINDIKAYDIDTNWEKFLKMEKIEYQIIKTFDTNYKIGRLNTVQMGNLYFTGFAGGFIDDIIGIGSQYAVISGVRAAQAIVKNKNYTELMKKIIKDIKRKHTLREALDLMGNKEFDNMNKGLDTLVVKTLTYKNPFFKSTQISPYVRAYSTIKKFTKKSLGMQQSQNQAQSQGQNQGQGQNQSQGQKQGQQK